MSDITINYKGSSIATMDASGTKTLLTEGKYCEDDIEVVYVSPGGGSTLGTKTISSNGTYNASSDSLDGYSQVTVTVPTGTARTSADLTANNLTVTVPAGLYAEAASKTLTDANLTAGNIKKDISIFGVTGTYEGGGGNQVYCTQYTLTSDTTIRDLLDSASYAVHSTSCIIIIRSNGNVAPSTGSYTMNNYWYVFQSGVRKNGRHYYKSGKVTPDNFEAIIFTNEASSAISISNGVLTSNYTGSSCLGTTGDTVTIAEIVTDANFWDVITGTQPV